MNNVTRHLKVIPLGGILLIMPSVSHAYLDPGTGSLLFSAIVSIASVVIFWGRTVISKISQLGMFLIGRTEASNTNNEIVIYSEGGQYWNLFRPIIDSLNEKKVRVSYWTSDSHDPGLKYSSKYLDSQFIGKGNIAYAKLNMMRAKVCVMTTPGLDVLQIKRSKSVEHYSHLVHAPTTGTYKLFSFDYFDSVLCSGPHQIEGIRELELKRSTKAKKLLETGCVYMDVLAQRKRAQESNPQVPRDQKTVLVAPSWGENGLLNRCGEEVLSGLLDIKDINVIVRPHPQSLIVEKAYIEELQNRFLTLGDRLTWDTKADNFDSLMSADLMVSDFSGVVFDFALAFQKPVICIDFEVSLSGLDANDISGGLWELRVLDQFGKRISLSNIGSLPVLITKLLQDDSIAEELTELRTQSVYNFGIAGEVAAQQLISIAAD